MPLEPFFHHCPEIGKAETRSINIVDGPDHGVPEGAYAFIEFYCTERGCDCRRVLLQVVSLREGVVASIGIGFDREAPMAGPFLDPLHDHCPYANRLLALAEEMLFSDPMYLARLERHYRMMREKVDRPGANERWWKRKPKKPKRRPRP